MSVIQSKIDYLHIRLILKVFGVLIILFPTTLQGNMILVLGPAEGNEVIGACFCL